MQEPCCCSERLDSNAREGLDLRFNVFGSGTALVVVDDNLKLNFFAAMSIAPLQPMFCNLLLAKSVVRLPSLVIFEALLDVSNGGSVKSSLFVLGRVERLTSWTNKLIFSSCRIVVVSDQILGTCKVEFSKHTQGNLSRFPSPSSLAQPIRTALLPDEYTETSLMTGDDS